MKLGLKKLVRQDQEESVYEKPIEVAHMDQSLPFFFTYHQRNENPKPAIKTHHLRYK